VCPRSAGGTTESAHAHAWNNDIGRFILQNFITDEELLALIFDSGKNRIKFLGLQASFKIYNFAEPLSISIKEHIKKWEH
jgi:hypothetical protein